MLASLCWKDGLRQEKLKIKSKREEGQGRLGRGRASSVEHLSKAPAGYLESCVNGVQSGLRGY